MSVTVTIQPGYQVTVTEGDQVTVTVTQTSAQTVTVTTGGLSLAVADSRYAAIENVSGLTEGRLPVKGSDALEDSQVYQSGTVVAVDDDFRLDGMLLGSPTNDTLRKMFTHTFSAGIFSGGELTDNGDGTVSVSAGTGMIRTGADSSYPILLFDWNTASSVTLTDNAFNYIYVDYNNGSPVISATTDYTGLDHSSQFIVGSVYREGTSLYILEVGQEIDDFIHLNFQRDWEVERFNRVSGLVTSETGTRNIAITAGAFYAAHQRFTTSAIDTSGTDTFTYYYRDGTGGWTKVTGQTQIDNTYYDDGSGTLAELTPNRYGVHWVFMLCNGEVAVVYGRGSYTLAEAKAVSMLPDLPDVIEEAGFIIAKIIIQKGASSFEQIETPWTTFFEGSIVTVHNALAGLQGGAESEYYHLTQSDYSALTDPNAQLEELQTDGIPTFSGLTINGNIAVTGTVDGVDVSDLSADVDGFPDELKNLTTAEIQQLENINTTTISTAQWGYLGALDQGLATTDSPTFAGLTVNGYYASELTVDQETTPSIKATQTAQTLQDGSSNTGTDILFNDTYVAFKFTADGNHNMRSFGVRMKVSATLSNPTSVVYGYIYSDSSGVPGSKITSGRYVSFGSVTTSYKEFQFYAGTTLSSGTSYWLVLRRTSTPSGGDIYLDGSATGTAAFAHSSDGLTWTTEDSKTGWFKLYGRTRYAIYGFSTNDYGIYGASTNNYGVYGYSVNGYGVRGYSLNNIAISGSSKNSHGVYGLSTNNAGVHGYSINNHGIYGVSVNNRSGYFYRNSSTATTPNTEIASVNTNDTHSVLKIRGDGTGDLLHILDTSTTVFAVHDGGDVDIVGDVDIDGSLSISSLTAGYVPYVGASGLVDSPIKTDGTNVGVSTDPASGARLEIDGSIRASGGEQSSPFKVLRGQVFSTSPIAPHEDILPNWFAEDLLAFKAPYKVERLDGETWIDVTSNADWHKVTSRTGYGVYESAVTERAKYRFYFDLGFATVAAGQFVSRGNYDLNTVYEVKLEVSDDSSFATGVTVIHSSTWQDGFVQDRGFLVAATSTYAFRRYMRITYDAVSYNGSRPVFYEFYFLRAGGQSPQGNNFLVPISWNDDFDIAIGKQTPNAKLEVLSTTEQLRLSYTSGSVYTSFTTDSYGDLTITPTGGNVDITGNLNVSSALDITGAATFGDHLYLNGTPYIYGNGAWRATRWLHRASVAQGPSTDTTIGTTDTTIVSVNVNVDGTANVLMIGTLTYKRTAYTGVADVGAILCYDTTCFRSMYQRIQNVDGIVQLTVVGIATITTPGTYTFYLKATKSDAQNTVVAVANQSFLHYMTFIN